MGKIAGTNIEKFTDYLPMIDDLTPILKTYKGSNLVVGFIYCHKMKRGGRCIHPGLKEALKHFEAGKRMIVFMGGVRRPKMSEKQRTGWEAMKVSDRVAVLSVAGAKTSLSEILSKFAAMG